jgi:hypothetical protein
MFPRRAFAIVLAPLALAACAAPRAERMGEPQAAVAADLVLRNGKVITVDAALGTVAALAVRDGRIVAAGSEAEIGAFVGAGTRVIDLQGRTAIPGFIEGHGHFTGIGDSRQILDLTRAESWDDIVAMVAEAAAKASPGAWIVGRGWHQEKWLRPPLGAVAGFPTHHAVSAVSPDNPVYLTHASGHACFANARAMALGKVDGGTQDPPGGEIVRDAQGEPIGVFSETAQALVGALRSAELARQPRAARREALRRSIRLADEECLRKGVTSFQDAGSSFETIDELAAVAEAGELGVRLYVMVRESNARLRRDLARYRRIGAADHHLTVRAIKRTLDGALGSRGAWLLEPYSDAPDSIGLATATVEEVAETAALAVANDYQLCVHAIGDRANREVLDLFERTFRAHPGLADPRWRIEHAQHLAAADIPRFGQLGVIASMQGIHCTSDAPWVVPRLGETRAAEGAYVWQKLMRSGALVTNGTDAPVEDVDPIASYYATVSRRLPDGTRFFADQCMSRMEALRSYTINAARAAFEEDLKGTLTPGKLADVVVLSQDITAAAEDRIPATRVDYTIVGGRVRYARDGGGGAGR